MDSADASISLGSLKLHMSVADVSSSLTSASLFNVDSKNRLIVLILSAVTGNIWERNKSNGEDSSMGSNVRVIDEDAEAEAFKARSLGSSFGQFMMKQSSLSRVCCSSFTNLVSPASLRGVTFLFMHRAAAVPAA